MKNFPCSLNRTSGGKIIFRYSILTAVGMLILSFALKTAGQMFYLITAVLLIIVGSVLCICKSQKGIFFSAVLLSLFCIRILYVLSVTIENSNYNNGSVDTITATVTTTPDYYEDSGSYGYCTVKVQTSDRELLSEGNLLYLFGDGVAELDLGDSVTVQVRLSPFDEKNHLSFYSENVFVKGECINTVFAQSNSKGIYGFAGTVREYVKTHLMRSTDNYGILLAVITGERAYITDELYEKVKVAGVSHILVVSGMHLAIICSVVSRLLGFLRGADWIKDVLLLVFLFLMMCVCGFGMSMLRAGIVYIFAVLYRRMKRLGDSILFLSNAVIVVLFIHPYAVHSIAFQLSFASTFGILVLAQKIAVYLNRKLKGNRAVKYMTEAAAVSLSAYIATLPIAVYNFGYISTYAVLVNIILSLPSTVMLVTGVLAIALGTVGFLERAMLSFADLIADFFVSVAEVVNDLPLCIIPLRNERQLAVLILLSMAVIYTIKTKPYRILLKKR